MERLVEAQNFEWEWHDNGCLSVSYIADAVIKHPSTNEVIWFNQMSLHHESYYHYHPDFKHIDFNDKSWIYPLTCKYGDGQELEEEFIRHVRDCIWKSAAAITIEAGKVIY